ncbi:peptidoglycan-binding domain-containing protein [Streptomyces sp. NBC_00557]|uniref:peptidoglycan-binding domain-containing protein n=1 Tax=Streptomyces sp. NBC_00557 TaxID=2975776 RepID=UPI002E80B3DE|nr:peptidoglycan-binding domain-containing protein [Streptomyces sp. NBC_00557]
MSAVAVAGITAGSLAGASAGFAASQPAARPTASNQRVSILAVNNLGLTTTQAKHWQCELRNDGFDPGAIDGQLGTDSWKAAQRFFNWGGYYIDGKLTVDGIVGTETIKALQDFLNAHSYSLVIDGVAGPKTKAAFADYNTTNHCG